MSSKDKNGGVAAAVPKAAASTEFGLHDRKWSEDQ